MFISDEGLMLKNAFTGETKAFEDFRDMKCFVDLHQNLEAPERPWYPVLEDTHLLDILDDGLDIHHVLNFYTRFFPVTVSCNAASALVIPRRTIPLMEDGKILLDVDDIPGLEEMYTWLQAENDPAVLKGYLPRLNKIREYVSMEEEAFELDYIWTGWFEDYIKRENPEFADKTAFLRSFDRWALSNPDNSFEGTFHIDWGTFVRASAEHNKLTHKTLPAYPGTDSPAVLP